MMNLSSSLNSSTGTLKTLIPRESSSRNHQNFMQSKSSKTIGS